MSRFIKLTKRIINTHCIEQIVIRDNSYEIYFKNHYFSGFTLFGSGANGTTDNYHYIYKDTDPLDYDIIKNWIDKTD